MPPEPRAITFRNAEGRQLFGTLHAPAVRRPDLPAIVLFSPGAKMRVGPGRLYIPLTEVLTDLGYVVLRFDVFGLGDSEGELEESLLVDVYSNIQVGRYVADGIAALTWLKREEGISRYIVGGLCGGALTGLLVAERELGIEAILSFGMPVTLDSDSAIPSKYLTRHDLAQLRRGYLAKLFNPEAWLRLLTFRSDLGTIFRSVVAGVTDRLRRSGGTGGAARTATLPPEQLANVNPLFPTAYFSFLGRGGRALMVFSEKDRMLGDWREKFVDLYPEQMRRFAPQITEHVVAGANHVLSERAWQQEMHEVARRWLGALPRP
ncbi:MAG: hypothetical protein IT357_15060 [Gemmatimonadaceae bacterium]|nr:hypothetical protein [Gemmatimonadaceae bacterium]